MTVAPVVHACRVWAHLSPVVRARAEDADAEVMASLEEDCTRRGRGSLKSAAPFCREAECRVYIWQFLICRIVTNNKAGGSLEAQGGSQ